MVRCQRLPAARHGHVIAWLEILKRLPAIDGEERMGKGAGDRPAKPRGDPENRLDAIVDKRTGLSKAELQIIVESEQVGFLGSDDAFYGGEGAIVEKDLGVGRKAFSHRRSRGHNHHLPVLQTVEHVVQVEEAGGQAALASGFDGLEHFQQDRFERHNVAADLFLGDLEDALFSAIDDQFSLFMRAINVAEDFVAGGDQLAEKGLLPNRLSVRRPVGGGGDDIEDLGEVRHAPHFFQKLALGQLVLNNHRINGPVLLVKLQQNVEDDLMIGLEKSVPIHDLDDRPDHLFVEHHGGQQRHLRRDVVRRELVELPGKCFDQLVHRMILPNKMLTIPGRRGKT